MSKIAEIDPLVGKIFDVLNEQEVGVGEKVQAAIRAGKLAELYYGYSSKKELTNLLTDPKNPSFPK